MKKNVVFLKRTNGLKWLCCISILIGLVQIGNGQEFYVGAFSIPPSTGKITETGATKSFVYDENGNMTTDGRRGVNISYNKINLPH